MKMKSIISTVLSVLFTSISVAAELNESCEIKGKYNGNCVYLPNCEYYFNMLQDYESLALNNQEVFQILREVSCGYVLTKPLICCPRNSDFENQSFHSPVHNSVAGNSGVISQQTNPVSNKSPVPTIQSPPNSVSTSTHAQPSTTTTTTTDECTKQWNTQSFETTNSIETTTPVVADTTTSQIIDNEKFKILPEECGRVLTFKYFRGNRTEFDDFPWTTLVEYQTPTGKSFGCGGALIHKRYVLTAAHCVTDLPPSWRVSKVRFGEYDIDTDLDCLPDGPNITICNDYPVDVTVEKVIAHSQFNSDDTSHLHDIALLRLAASVNFTSTVKPICLPTKNPFLQRYYTSGWGKDLTNNSIRNGTNLKHMSYINLADQKSCEDIYARDGVKISNCHVCGGAKQGQKPCIGDGGGPLMGLEDIPSLEKRVVAFGVLSLNKPATGVCQSSYPSVYTKVLDYMDWILENLRN